MATYIMLNKFTQQGSQSIKDLPKRIEENRPRFMKLGAELKSWHLTLGEYDAVVILEAPNDEVIAKIALAICAQGNAQTHTMRAFTLEELKTLSAQLP